MTVKSLTDEEIRKIIYEIARGEVFVEWRCSPARDGVSIPVVRMARDLLKAREILRALLEKAGPLQRDGWTDVANEAETFLGEKTPGR